MHMNASENLGFKDYEGEMLSAFEIDLLELFRKKREKYLREQEKNALNMKYLEGKVLGNKTTNRLSSSNIIAQPLLSKTVPAASEMNKPSVTSDKMPLSSTYESAKRNVEVVNKIGKTSDLSALGQTPKGDTIKRRRFNEDSDVSDDDDAVVVDNLHVSRESKSSEDFSSYSPLYHEIWDALSSNQDLEIGINGFSYDKLLILGIQIPPNSKHWGFHICPENNSMLQNVLFHLSVRYDNDEEYIVMNDKQYTWGRFVFLSFSL